jgi:hypothetical protein
MTRGLALRPHGAAEHAEAESESTVVRPTCVEHATTKYAWIDVPRTMDVVPG